MGWIGYQLPKVTNLTGTLAAGGTLDASTTYYFKVFAAHQTTNASAPFWGPHSDTFSIATDATNRTVNLTWDIVTNPATSTNVAAYNVLVSKSPTGLDAWPSVILTTANAVHHAASYYTPSTLTNSYSVASNPTLSINYTPSGIPYMTWTPTGTETCTFESLYEYMTVTDPTLSGFVDPLAIQSSVVVPYGWVFKTNIYVNRNATNDATDGAYTMTCDNRVVIVHGAFYINQTSKNRIRNNFLAFYTMSHSSGTGNFQANVAGAIITDNKIQTCVGNSGIQYAGLQGKTWQSGGFAPSNYALTAGATFAGNIFRCSPNNLDHLTATEPHFVTYNGQPGINLSIRPGGNVGWGMSRVRGGGVKFFANSNYTWGPTCFNDGADHTNEAYQYHQFWAGHYIDCVWRYSGDPHTNPFPDTTACWDFRISLTATYGSIRLLDTAFPISKTIRVKVMDTEGNLIPDAKVTFLDKEGRNMTRGYLPADITRSSPPGYPGVNYANPLTETELWFRYNNASGVSATYQAGELSPVIGETYWLRGEKIMFTEDLGTTGQPDVTAKKFRVARGVDNSIPGKPSFQDSYYSYNEFLVRAKDYHLTDANGFCLNVTPFETYRYKSDWATIATGWNGLNNKLSQMVDAGRIDQWDHYPITVKVEKAGYRTFTTQVSKQDALDAGNFHVYVTAVMKPVIPFITTLGKSTIFNLDATNPDNKHGFIPL